MFELKKIKHKKLLIIMIIICLGVLQLTGIIPYIIARSASTIYIANNHPMRELKFDHVDGSRNPVFENSYSVYYKDKYENSEGFVMYPKQFPTYVLFDSMNPPC